MKKAKQVRYVLYRHICPNGKYYYGITCLPVNRRWKNGNGYKNMFFGRAVAKYGWDNIQHDIIARNLTQQEAEKLERELILTMHSNNPQYGYNVENGGNSAASVSEQTRKKQRLAHLGQTPWNKGVAQSDEVKNKLRKALNPTPVFCIELNILYPSIQNAAKELNIPSANISQVCKGQRKTAGTLHWRYRDEN